MSSNEFDRKREPFPEELALHNLKELTKAERAGLHLLMIQTSDPYEREDILEEAQQLANKRAEEAKKHSYAATKSRLKKTQKETKAELTAFTQHRNRHVKVLGKVTMMAGYFMTPKRIRPTKYYWLIPEDLAIPDLRSRQQPVSICWGRYGQAKRRHVLLCYQEHHRPTGTSNNCRCY